MPVATETQMLGATIHDGRTEFRVWAPSAQRVQVRLLGRGDFAMERDGDLFAATLDAAPGQRYFYLVDDKKPVPDPVSRLLPEGVHGPTEIVDPERFRWSDAAWRGLPLEQYVLYELHVGTFTPEGTFDAVIGKLDELRGLGVTALEVMPVAAFPGQHNWGYDGVSPYAVQASYGGPDGLKRLVDAAHAKGLAVVLDVVYNHLGNEGNYLRFFGPYFTARHHTPWGEAVNYDDEGSDGVRAYFVENALYWLREYHMDGLRLDAVQTIHDESPRHILAELGDKVQEFARANGRTVCVIAESDENDARIVRPAPEGYGLDAVWSDDFHHSVHALFTGERRGYYEDFGKPEQVAKALGEGFVFQGEPFRFWNGRPRGTSPVGMRAPQYVICLQNHDQVGNRAHGERLGALVPRGALFVAAALLLLAPETPLLFMGEEYDEAAPFQFFTEYLDPQLQEAVRRGRREEFKKFGWDDVPDPQDAETFERSRLRGPQTAEQRELRTWYKRLLELRKEYVTAGPRTCRVEVHGDALVMQGPRIAVAATLRKGAALAQIAGQELMRHDADGYAVVVADARG